MSMRLKQGLLSLMTGWLEHKTSPPGTSLSSFDEMRQIIRPADVILVNGRTRASGVIQTVTLSPWSHMALYIGCLSELRDRELAARLRGEQEFAADEQLTLEAAVGKGVVIGRLARYEPEHLRLCRPSGLSADDAQAVIDYGLARVGRDFDQRQILDMLRFFFPYALLPRRWRSILFETRPGETTHEICSTFLVKAFHSVGYPVLPQTSPGDHGQPVRHHRNIKLMAPRDFDYSPYFDIVKYPLFGDSGRDYREAQRAGNLDTPHAGGA